MVAVLLACASGPVPVDTGELADSSGRDSAVADTGPTSTAWAEVAGAPADGLGNAAEGAEDLDGDGDDDLLVAAYLGNRVCAVFGPVAATETTMDATSSACFVGELDTDYAGYGMAAVGDLTGDGALDLVVGSIGNGDAGANAGKVYLVAGPLAPGSWSLGDAATTWIGETASDYAGIDLARAGDLTGDGLADLLVGASGYDGEGGGGGRAYVLASPFDPGAFSMADAYASVTGLGAPAGPAPPPHGAFGTGDFVGDALVGDSDFDGDGFADLALGASGDQTVGLNSGKVAVLFGPVEPGAQLVSDADVTLFGEAEFTYTGSPIRGTADLTGDGKDDLLVAADTLGAGVVYIASPAVGQTSVAESATRFEGEVAGDLFGYAISTAADLEGDGYLDVAIAAPSSDRWAYETGAVWVFAGPFGPGVVSAAQGTAIDGGAKAESFGSALDVAGDLDSDGDLDLVVGARNSDTNGGFSGKFYLFDP